MSSRVVITGIGAVSPIGCGRESFWRSCLAGRSGVARLESPWVTETDVSTEIAAVVRGFDPQTAGITPRQAGLLDRTSLFALVAAHDALEDAGLPLEEAGKQKLAVGGVDPTRLATVIGSGIGGITSLEVTHAIWREKRSKSSIKRYSLPMLIPNAAAGQVAIRFGARAESKAISTACAAGTMSLGDAWRILQRNEADVVLAGGTEGAAGDDDSYGLMGFDRLRTLSTRNDEPQRASRPFDLDRDGFVLGEGAAVMVLERETHAAARGARVWAAIEGYAANCDAHSMMQLDGSGRSIVSLIESAVASAGLGLSDVDHVSAHATSTQLNDRIEALALRKTFGARCDEIAVTGLKSMTGHCMAGSGPMEAAAAALSLHHGLLAPTINYETPDPECDVDVVANEPRERLADVCLKLSYGFGGHNACLVLTRA